MRILSYKRYINKSVLKRLVVLKQTINQLIIYDSTITSNENMFFFQNSNYEIYLAPSGLQKRISM